MDDNIIVLQYILATLQRLVRRQNIIYYAASLSNHIRLLARKLHDSNWCGS